MALLRRFTNLFSRSRVNRDIDAELQSHIAMRSDDNVAAGMTEAAARRDALLRFGNPTATRERVATADVALWLESIWFDLRYAARQLRRSRWFAVTAVVTLAMAIGANAVVFSILNAFILRPLNVPHAESLYALFHDGNASESYLSYVDLRTRNRSFDDLSAFTEAQTGLDTGNDPSRAFTYETSGNYFDALELRPYLGQFFHASDERGANSAPYLVLTYAYWQNHFHADRGVVGRVVRLNKHPFTILGVAPPEFHGTLMFFNPDFFVPLINQEQVEGIDNLNDRSQTSLFMLIGHLKPGVSVGQATADLNSIGSYLEKSYPKDVGKRTFTLGRPNLYGDYLGGPVRTFMTGLMSLAGLILLAACANLGSLFAARASDRSREVALRVALGSSRKRVLRGLFAEASLISLSGGVIGLVGSVVLLRGLSTWQPFAQWPIHLAVNPDSHVYAVALLLTLISGLIFGAVPVRQVLRTNPYELVKAGVAGSSAGARSTKGWAGRRITVQDVLLVMQIAICGVLVTSSIVAVRGLARTLKDNFGFEVEKRIQVDTDLTMAGYTGERVVPMQKRLVEGLSALPGVDSVGFADTVPLGDGAVDSNVFKDDSSDLRPRNAALRPFMFKVSPGYFHAAGTRVVSGREFTWHDDGGSPRVAVVNQEFARILFGAASKAIGGHFKMPDGARVEVVGLAQQGKYASLSEDAKPAIFLSTLQSGSSQTYLVIRSMNDPEQLEASVRSRLREIDAALPFQIQTRNGGMDTLLFGPRMATLSLGVLGIMGAMLSITGIFGMAAHSVSRRLRELGIRVALGAQRIEVLQAALGHAFRLLALGSVVGLLLGILASRGLALVVHEATAGDPLALAGVVLAMALLGVVATWIPAQRALSVDPMMLLRDE